MTENGTYLLLRLLKWTAVIYIGLVLIHMTYHNTVGASDLFILVGGAVGGAFTCYGIVAFIANVREGKTRKGIWGEIKDLFKKAFR